MSIRSSLSLHPPTVSRFIGSNPPTPKLSRIKDGMTPIGQMPLATRPPFEDITVNLAPGTREDCRFYHIGGELLDADTRSTSAACADVAAAWGVTVEQMLGWNPSLEEGPSCVLQDDAQYCVGMEDIVDEGMTEACVGTGSPKKGDSCRSFRARWGLPDQQFAEWNPVVGENCEGFNLGKVSMLPFVSGRGANPGSLDVGSVYCTQVEHFRAPGMFRMSRHRLLV